MNIAQIEKNLQKLMKSFDKDTFIYDLLLAYGLPKAIMKNWDSAILDKAIIPGVMNQEFTNANYNFCD